jgi:hypothetical protein
MGRCIAGKALSQYLDGELDPAAAAEVKRHVAACPVCASALAGMEAVEARVRGWKAPDGETPDVASRVTADLRGRGEFFVARVAAGRRRVFGERSVGARMAASFALAAAVVACAVMGLDWATRRAWVRRTEPVLADAERVLVRLVLVDLEAEAQAQALARAREQSREFALSERLAEARAGAGAAVADDLAYLETTFSLLAGGRPLPADLVAALAGGEVLKRAERVRESL